MLFVTWISPNISYKASSSNCSIPADGPRYNTSSKFIAHLFDFFSLPFLFYGKKWKADYMDKFPKEEYSMYMSFLEGALNLLAYNDRDRFITQIEEVLNENTRNNIWEVEHTNIVNAIDSLTREKNRFAARLEIVGKTGYSQKRIDEHLKEYYQSPFQNKREEELLLMRERLLSRCYAFAPGGNMSAARLFLEATANQRQRSTIQNQLNNFIQVNNLTITKEQIAQLPEDKRQQMKEIILLLNKGI